MTVLARLSPSARSRIERLWGGASHDPGDADNAGLAGPIDLSCQPDRRRPPPWLDDERRRLWEDEGWRPDDPMPDEIARRAEAEREAWDDWRFLFGGRFP